MTKKSKPRFEASVLARMSGHRLGSGIVYDPREEWSIVQGALQILTVSDSLTSRASVFEASLRATLARLSTSLSLSVFGSSLDQNQVTNSTEDGLGGRAALDVASLRLVDVPEKAKKLFNLLNQVYIKLSLSAFALLMPRSSIKRDIVRSSNQ